MVEEPARLTWLPVAATLGAVVLSENCTPSLVPAALVPEQLLPRVAVTLTWSAGVVTGLSFASRRATVTRSVALPSAALGEALAWIASLFGAPLRIVVSVAEALLTPVVLALAVHVHVPGVLVAVRVKKAEPLATVVGPPEPPPLRLHTLEPVSREMVIAVVLLVVTITPFASVTSTSRTAFEMPSAVIVPSDIVVASLAAAPAAATVICCVQPVSEPELSEMTPVPVAFRTAR